MFDSLGYSAATKMHLFSTCLRCKIHYGWFHFYSLFVFFFLVMGDGDSVTMLNIIA